MGGQDAHGVAVGTRPVEGERPLVQPAVLQVVTATASADRSAPPRSRPRSRRARRPPAPPRPPGRDRRGRCGRGARGWTPVRRCRRRPCRRRPPHGRRPPAARPRGPWSSTRRGRGRPRAPGPCGRAPRARRAFPRTHAPCGPRGPWGRGWPECCGPSRSTAPAGPRRRGRRSGGDAVLDERVEGVGLQLVAPFLAGGGPVGGGDRPAEVGVEPLVPPAVTDREVEAAVERGLHPAGAAGLQRAQRVVEPDVAAGVELLGHAHAVVRQEDDAVAYPGVVGEPHQLLDEPLAAVVGGVGLRRRRRSGSGASGGAAAPAAGRGRAA